MTSLFKILSFTFFLMILFGCSGKPEQAQLKISIAAVTGSSYFPGGLYVMGKNKESGIHFVRSLDATDTLTLDLDIGKWSFYALGWTSNAGAYEGDVHCEILEDKELIAGDNPLSLIATKAKCASPVFGAALDNNNQFLPINFHSCGNLRRHILNGDVASAGSSLNCGPSSPYLFDGGVKGFKISLNEKLRTGEISLGLESQCISVSSAVGSIGSMKLPIGSPDINISYTVQAYSDNTCSTKVSDYIFPNGLFMEADANAVNIVDIPGGSQNIFFHSELCNSPAHFDSNGQTFAVSGAGRHLICTKTQFENIGTSPSSLSEEFVLGRDINFGGSNNTVVGVFNGNLRGEGFSLIDGNKPLFDRIEASNSGGEGRNRIANFNIIDFDINETGVGTNENYGLLAKTLVAPMPNGSSGVELEISHIEIDSQSSVTVNSNGSGNNVNIGALVGEVDFDSNNDGGEDKVYIREIKSKADVIGINSGSAVFVAGGLVGKSRGDGGASNQEVVFEENSVGVADDKDWSNDSKRIDVSSDGFTGGLIGESHSTEIRHGNTVIAKTTGDSHMGGFVGDANTFTSLRRSFSNLIAISSGGTTSKVGGAIGNIGGDFQVEIEAIVSNLSINDNTNQFNEVGGILGSAIAYASNELTIKDVKAVVDINANGNRYGGIVGRYSDAAFNHSTDPSFIINSLAIGDISAADITDATNHSRGGFVGELTGGRVTRSIVTLGDLEGDTKIAGGIGNAVKAFIREAYIKIGNLHGDSGTPQSGGVAGLVADGTISARFFEEIKVDTQTNFPNTGGCLNNTCGAIIGDIVNSPLTQLVENIVYLSDEAVAIGDPVYAGASVIVSLSDQNSDVSCSIGGAFDSLSGVCEPVFKRRWSEFSEINLAAGEFLAGNFIEPFPLKTPAHWNSIQQDVFLLTKTFELENNINFNNGTFNPIGEDDNTIIDKGFSGGIISNGFELQNITFNGTNINSGGWSSTGAIPILKGGHVGLRGEPLIVNGLTLNCTTNKCGFIGESHSGKIFVQVKNGSITGSAASDVGGLLGFATGGETEMSNSGYQGFINAASSSNVGGLVGSYQGATGGVRIDESYVKLDYILGANKVGGLIGHAPSTAGTLQVDTAYVWLDINGTHAGNDINGTPYIGGIFGFLDQNLSGDSGDIYLDYSNATVPGGFVVNAGVTGTPTLPSSIFTVNDQGVASGIGSHTNYISHAELFSSEFEDENDWMIDPISGRVVFEWEIKGFNTLHH